MTGPEIFLALAFLAFLAGTVITRLKRRARGREPEPGGDPTS
jgi:hypothetical protein